ncbi:hypothetical protein OGZ02_16430 [Brachyspira hyodysenteriae]|nr:hypothetical protein [Brachyspira hyodysenteriae]MDA1470347.1 hypothetical protein [Brachyspira hyodysenteriae]
MLLFLSVINYMEYRNPEDEDYMLIDSMKLVGEQKILMLKAYL